MSIIIISILTVIAFLFFLSQGEKLIISMLAAPAFLFSLKQGKKLIISMLAAPAFPFFLNQGKGVDASMKCDLTTGALGGHFTTNGQAIKVTAGNTILSYSDGWGTWPWACTACVTSTGVRRGQFGQLVPTRSTKLPRKGRFHVNVPRHLEPGEVVLGSP